MKNMKLADCLCYLTGKVFRNMLSCYTPSIKEYNITVSQLFLLLALYEKDGSTPQELSTKLALNSSTLSGILDRLESKGFIKREINTTDRRSIIIRLTDKARDLEDELWSIYEKINGELCSALSQEEIKELYNIMAKLEAKANEMQNKE